ncbi:MAG: NACHT domain-containing protein [Leptolyngbyaceae cyanobacterium SL_7_1]|nr:NACHT domain-containing protein [Leptolyngbyaceae cyanobacterium SL_7_1]
MAQTLLKPRRYRGFVLTAAGLSKLQAQMTQLETQTKLRQNSRTIAERVQLSDPNGIHPITVRKILHQQGGVDKRSIRCIFDALGLELQPGDYAHASLVPQIAPAIEESPHSVSPRSHWGEAIDISHFYGRADELAYLQQRLVDDRCRLIVLGGMAGLGKTALAVKLAKTVESLFDAVVWRSLRHAPHPKEEFRDILGLLPSDLRTAKTTVGHLTRTLLTTLQRYRCLLVFDQLEPLLQSRAIAGRYNEGYEAYGELLQLVAEVPHESCVIVTTREFPKDLKLLKSPQVCVLQLSGFNPLDSQHLFAKPHCIEATNANWHVLNDYYAGNPRLLKMVVSRIEDYFGGSVTEYLQNLTNERLWFSDLEDLLAQPLDRLSLAEKVILRQLASQRQWCSLAQIRGDEVDNHWYGDLLEILDSLNRRSLIEKTIVSSPIIRTDVVDGAGVASATSPPIADEISVGERRITCFRVSPVLADYVSDRPMPTNNYAVA